MCLIFIAYQVNSDYPLVVAANRDEYFARPSREVHFWPDHPEVFGGRDLLANGSWMAVTREGRFAAVTNWSQKSERSSGYKSRGELVRKFLVQKISALDFVSLINPSVYRGCNLIVFDGLDLVHWCNLRNRATILKPGVHGITNANINNHPSRVSSGLKEFEILVTDIDVESLLAMLGPKETMLEDDCFIEGREYGTRASTVLLFRTHSINVFEQLYGPNATRRSLNSEKLVRDND